MAALLAAATLAAYAGAWSLDFVNFDDPNYVTDNPQVLAGLTADGVRWAFTSGHASNWHPLTWLSHMLDVQLFGLDPAGHHATSVVLHLLNSLLLFGFLAQASGAPRRSAVVAALFALHPLHVESVAWVSERKDVLSTLFMMLTLWAYLHWRQRQTVARFGLVALCCALGLASKPMLVTLPFVLWLLDAWPLHRYRLHPLQTAASARLLAEKWPLLALAALSSYVTVRVQSAGGAVVSTEGIELSLRVQNALVSWLGYLRHMAWPEGLAAFYPYPAAIPPWQWLGALFLLAGMTAFGWWQRGTRPYLLVGWLWYLGTSVPVIGLVQVGNQAMADRYTYIPLIGVFIIVAWGGAEVFRLLSLPRWIRGAVVFAMLGTLALLTWRQVPHWQDGKTLWSRTLAVTTGNYRAHDALGALIEAEGRRAEAIEHYRAAIRIEPRFAEGHNRLGAALAESGRYDEALPYYREAVRLRPSLAIAWSNLGIATTQTGDPQAALAHFEKALSIDPGYAGAHNGRGFALDELGRLDEAVDQYRRALALDPSLAAAHGNLAVTLYRQGQLDAAIAELERAVALDPGGINYRFNLAQLLSARGDTERADEQLRALLQRDPRHDGARRLLQQLSNP